MADSPVQFRDLLYVVAAFGLIYLLFSQLIESPAPQVMVSASGSEVVIQADRSGHFRGEGEINGAPVHFLVDTGASYLSIPKTMAQALGLSRGQTVKLQTAAGEVEGYRTMVESVRFTVLEQHNVAAVVIPQLKQPLLGMNFLRQLSITQRKGEMVLRVE